MPLHPLSRALYRNILEIGAMHPSMSLGEVREIARVEFYRRGQSSEPEHLKRAIAYGRKQLRHMKNAVMAYNVSTGGALDGDWKRLNDQSARASMLDPSGLTKYVPRRNLMPSFRQSIPASSRQPRPLLPERESLGMVNRPPSLRSLAETSFAGALRNTAAAPRPETTRDVTSRDDWTIDRTLKREAPESARSREGTDYTDYNP
ncbi:hypothetical protein DIPPA_13601 [Diplonema papillatum]|nr:hypothetical protein DIPPA_13601 [Diplonema papillatum]